MPPIAVVLFLTGIAAWANAFYFLGIGADRQEGGSDPIKVVGWISLVAGLSNFTQIVFVFGSELNVLGGLVVFYAAFFVLLGIVEILGLDLRVVGNVSIAVALVPLVFWYNFFTGAWMFRTILIFWAVLFLAIAATTYGRLNPKTLGWMLVLTAAYTFWTPATYLALGINIP